MMMPGLLATTASNIGFNSGIFSTLAQAPPGAVKKVETIDDGEPNIKLELYEVDHRQDSWRTVIWQLLKFVGPALMVSVGYVDPGNWETDIQGGVNYGYKLLYVLVFSNWLAILLQTLAARLGLVTDALTLKQIRNFYPRVVNLLLWFLCEIAIMATDLAEVLGTAIGLKLLFGIPILYGVIVTACDTLVLMLLQSCGMRVIEFLIFLIMATILVCFIIELVFAKPDIVAVLYGVVPTFPPGSIPVSAGMVGATIMPHNIYLHSGLIVRKRSTDAVLTRRLTRFSVIDSFFSLHIALFLNGAIVVMAAASFYGRKDVEALEDASALLGAIFGSAASIVFGIALLLAGQQSTITGTMAGEIVMEGFLNLRIPAVLRRIITRGLAIIPAAVVIIVVGDVGASDLLLWSQVILSVCLPFAMIPLIRITSNDEMGVFKNGWIIRIIGWISVLFITGLNVWLIVDTIQTNFGEPPWYRLALFVVAGAFIILFLILIMFIPIKPKDSLVLFPTDQQRKKQLAKLRADLMEINLIQTWQTHKFDDIDIQFQ